MDQAHLFEGPLSPVWSCMAYLYTECYVYDQAHPHDIPSNGNSSDFEPYNNSSGTPDDNYPSDNNGTDSGSFDHDSSGENSDDNNNQDGSDSDDQNSSEENSDDDNNHDGSDSGDQSSSDENSDDDNGSQNDESGSENGDNSSSEEFYNLKTAQKYSMIPFELLSLNQIGQCIDPLLKNCDSIADEALNKA